MQSFCFLIYLFLLEVSSKIQSLRIKKNFYQQPSYSPNCGLCCYAGCKTGQISTGYVKINGTKPSVNYRTYQIGSHTYSFPAIVLSRSFTFQQKTMPIEKPTIPVQSIQTAAPEVDVSMLNVESNGHQNPHSIKKMLLSCTERHNNTYNHFLLHAKPNTPLANALKSGGNIRLPLVLPVMNGNFFNQGTNLTMQTSVVLVIDNDSKLQERRFIIVDTGLSHLKQSVIEGLLIYGVDPSMIDTVVITHPDTETMGNLNLFPCAQVFSINRISRENFFVEQNPPTFDSNQSNLPFYKLFDNTKLYLTPGYSFQDQSLIVQNVENHGTVAVVGKLVLNETDLSNSNISIREFATEDVDHRKLWQATRQEIVCMTDFIIPGNGSPFKVNQSLKQLAECPHKIVDLNYLQIPKLVKKNRAKTL